MRFIQIQNREEILDADRIIYAKGQRIHNGSQADIRAIFIFDSNHKESIMLSSAGWKQLKSELMNGKKGIDDKG